MLRLILLSALLAGAWLLASVNCAAEAQARTGVQASPFLLEKVRQQEWLLIDVRSEQEFSQGHIPGAINLPYEDIDDYISQLTDHKDKPVILYCRSGRRARLAMQTLEQYEFSDLRHLEGDMLGWYESDLPVQHLM